MDKNCKNAIEQCKKVLLDDYKRLKKEITDLNEEIIRLKEKKQTDLRKYAIEKYQKQIIECQKMINSLIYILDLN